MGGAGTLALQRAGLLRVALRDGVGDGLLFFGRHVPVIESEFVHTEWCNQY